tara:strand:- start:7528 stop:7764 length:237 start_codon:yes stop_codon:yes gene_type:complete
LSKTIARKIHFSRLNKIKLFVERFNKMKASGRDSNMLVDYAFGVCLSNKAIQKGFIKALSQHDSKVATEVESKLRSRQ